MLTPIEYATIAIEKNPDIVQKCTANPKLIGFLYAKVCEHFGIQRGDDTSEAQETLRLIGLPTNGLDLDF